jgi:hypothetical protein
MFLGKPFLRKRYSVAIFGLVLGLCCPQTRQNKKIVGEDTAPNISFET